MLPDPADPPLPSASRALAAREGLVPLALLASMIGLGVAAWREPPPDAAPPDLSVLPDLTMVPSATGAREVRLAVDAPTLDPVVVGRHLGVAAVAADAPDATHALALLPPGLPASGWRDALPPPRLERVLASGWTLRLWDRPLPPERLLAGGRIEDHFPSAQVLWIHEDGVPVRQFGPASSVALARVAPAPLEGADAADTALFVRGQALWRAERTVDASQAGGANTGSEVWSTPVPLGIRAVDPALVRLDDGSWRLYAVTFAEEVGDPVGAPTTVRSWRSPDLRTFTEEPGVRLSGTGLLDPSVALRPDGTWEMWLTEQGRRLRRATSPDALAWALDEALPDVLAGATVPEVAPDASWMVVQRRVADRSALYLHVRGAGDAWSAAQPLEVCGTGAARAVGAQRPRSSPPPTLASVRAALGWTDSREPCGPPYAFPSPAPG